VVQERKALKKAERKAAHDAKLKPEITAGIIVQLLKLMLKVDGNDAESPAPLRKLKASFEGDGAAADKKLREVLNGEDAIDVKAFEALFHVSVMADIVRDITKMIICSALVQACGSGVFGHR
jgi:hypothetical protein